MKYSRLLLGAIFSLAGCGSSTPADNAADQLENAAEQSDPAAAAVLDNEADSIRDNGIVSGNSSDANGTVQRAMQNAGDAQTKNVQ